MTLKCQIQATHRGCPYLILNTHRQSFNEKSPGLRHTGISCVGAVFNYHCGFLFFPFIQLHVSVQADRFVNFDICKKKNVSVRKHQGNW